MILMVDRTWILISGDHHHDEWSWHVVITTQLWFFDRVCLCVCAVWLRYNVFEIFNPLTPSSDVCIGLRLPSCNPFRLWCLPPVLQWGQAYTVKQPYPCPNYAQQAFKWSEFTPSQCIITVCWKMKLYVNKTQMKFHPKESNSCMWRFGVIFQMNRRDSDQD